MVNRAEMSVFRMPTSISELNEFHQFSLAKLNSGNTSTLRELVTQWEAIREREEVNGAIREGLKAIDEGRVRPYEESMAEFRAKRNLAST